MEAVIQIAETHLEKLKNMGVEIVCTEENAVIPSPFTHTAIRAETRRYLNLFGDGREIASCIENLSEAVIHRMNKALQEDGSLSWGEVWEIIGFCYEEKRKHQEAKTNEKGTKIYASNEIHLP